MLDPEGHVLKALLKEMDERRKREREEKRRREKKDKDDKGKAREKEMKAGGATPAQQASASTPEPPKPAHPSLPPNPLHAASTSSASPARTGAGEPHVVHEQRIRHAAPGRSQGQGGHGRGGWGGPVSGPNAIKPGGGWGGWGSRRHKLPPAPMNSYRPDTDSHSRFLSSPERDPHQAAIEAATRAKLEREAATRAAKGKDKERDRGAEDRAHAEVVAELACNGYDHLRLKVDSGALDAVREDDVRAFFFGFEVDKVRRGDFCVCVG